MRAVRASGDGAKPQQSQVSSPVQAYLKDDLGLSFYSQPPGVEVSIREFEEFTLARLKLLHAFDRLCGYDKGLQDIATELGPKLNKELQSAELSLSYPTADHAYSFAERKEEVRRRDAIGHYALRLSFCKHREMRDWFLRQEQRLFLLRFDALNLDAKEEFLAKIDMNCKKFVQSEHTVKLEDLQHTTAGAKIWKDVGKPPELDPHFYTMPFQDLPPSLISARKVVIRGGQAYVPSSALKVIVASRFRDGLARSLDGASAGLQAALGDPRVGSFLRYIQDNGMQLLIGTKSTSTEDLGERLTPENFEELLTRSFPPCMRRIVEKQRDAKKHLKHAGRLQLRPFLKDCGFTLEESQRWWMKEMCRDPQVDATVYEKNYTYDVEHTYGKKGHLQGQNSFGCPKIIGFPYEAAGQVHGCPFCHLETPQLSQLLHRWHVPETTVMDIEKLVTNGKHYQLGCLEYFKATHPGHTGDGVGNSPGDFFRESCRHYTKKAEKEGKATSPQKAPSPQKAN